MRRPPTCLSELRLATLLQYSPDGTSETSRVSKESTIRIKRGSPIYIARIGLRVEELVRAEELSDFFNTETTLVPVPRSQPLRSPGTLWPALRICEELERRGLCHEIARVLVRKRPIDKSALHRSAPQRPSPEEHIKTMAAESVFKVSGRQITLVDDVVTRGSTLIATATLLKKALPKATIVAFAAVRTMSKVEVDQMLDPVKGWITYRDGRLKRDP